LTEEEEIQRFRNPKITVKTLFDKNPDFKLVENCENLVEEESFKEVNEGEMATEENPDVDADEFENGEMQLENEEDQEEGEEEQPIDPEEAFFNDPMHENFRPLDENGERITDAYYYDYKKDVLICSTTMKHVLVVYNIFDSEK
jgi:hypothetical protein